MSLRDYLLWGDGKRDNFKLDDEGIMGFEFPCNLCLHRHGTDKDEPCRTCDHNLNAVQENEE